MKRANSTPFLSSHLPIDLSDVFVDTFDRCTNKPSMKKKTETGNTMEIAHVFHGFFHVFPIYLAYALPISFLLEHHMVPSLQVSIKRSRKPDFSEI